MNWTQHVKAYRYLTPDMLRLAMPRCPDPTAWALAFDAAIYRFVIRDTAMLLAQVGHESSDLTQLSENLNYSAKRLTEVWPSRFPTLAAAQPFARNPARNQRRRNVKQMSGMLTSVRQEHFEDR